MKIYSVAILTQKDEGDPSDTLCRIGIKASHHGELLNAVVDVGEKEAAASDCADKIIGAIEIAVRKAMQELVDKCAS